MSFPNMVVLYHGISAMIGLVFALVLWIIYPLDKVDDAACNKSGQVSWSRVQARGEGNVLLVDARSEAAFAQGHLPNAISLNMDNLKSALPALLDKWTPDKAVVVYCGGGACANAREVARYLREKMGLKKVYTLIGGLEAARQ